MYTAENARFAEHISVPKDVFGTPTVLLEMPASEASRPAAAPAFMLAANLLSRIFTKLYLLAPDLPIGPNAWHLKTLAEIAAPLNQISEGSVQWGRPESADIVIGVGGPPTATGKFTTFFSFSGWDAALEQQLPSDQPGVFGALFAACYGVAQAFLYAAELAGAQHRPMRPFALSLLTYAASGPQLPHPAKVDFGTVHLVGVGAVGSALIYALGHIPDITGVLHAIDNDFVDETNLNRYVLMRKQDAVPLKPGQKAGRAKADVAVDALAGRRLVVSPHPMSFGEFRVSDESPIELLITPVDSETGRRKLASYIPRLVLNASTGHTKVTISRHGFADGKACLGCLYLPPDGQPSTEKRLADDLGLSMQEVEDHLANNRPVTLAILRRVEQHRRLQEGTLDRWVGQHLQSLYQRAVCGEAAIATAAGTIVSPLSFISAAAGVLLAVELVKLSTPALHSFVLNNYFRFDTLMNPNPDFKSVRLQEPTRRCICWDRDYIDIYKTRFA